MHTVIVKLFMKSYSTEQMSTCMMLLEPESSCGAREKADNDPPGIES